MKQFTKAEIAAYNAAHTTPHRKVIAAQVAESKLLPVKRRVNRNDNAEQVLERKMLHGENS